MPTPPGLTTLQPHPKYYFKGGDTAIIVGGTRFLILSEFLCRDSQVFHERIRTQTSEPSSPSSKTREIQEIIIHPDENVSPDDFALLCWIFFNEKLSIYETSLENWETILRLSCQYKFIEAKDLAFREIDKPGAFSISLVDRIVLYRKYEAKRIYLEKLYVELLSRPDPLTIEEGDKLSLKLALLISGARERLRATSEKLMLSDPLPASMYDKVKDMVASIFWDGPAPDLSHATSNTSIIVPVTHTNGASSPLTSSPPSKVDITRLPNGSGESFGTFGVAGKKKGRKNAASLGDWDD